VPGFDYLILVEWFSLKANNKSLAPTPGTNSKTCCWGKEATLSGKKNGIGAIVDAVA
jgi:hypothetical protein